MLIVYLPFQFNVKQFLMDHIVITLLSTCYTAICNKLVIFFNVLHISLFYLPMTRILARELEHLIWDQAPEAWILACKILIHLLVLLPQKVFLGYNLGSFYLVNYISQIFYVLYVLII